MPSYLPLLLASVLYYLTTYKYSVYGATVVSTKQGRVHGTTATSLDGTVYNTFYGIPFARPPVKYLRFQPPVAWDGTWENELNATQPPQPCAQHYIGVGIIGIEDCLNLNVYAPANAQPGDNLPVIVFIVGGGFTQGSNAEYLPSAMMNKNRGVIVVTPNFRVGALGLLSTGDSVLPGNMQLKDQTMALQWVNHNIRSFGGDPNRVTLNGFSSGSMNIHSHMFSPLSKGLFHRTILQSGTTVVPMAYFDEPTSRNVAFEIGTLLGCNAKTSEGLLKCLLAVKAEDLIAAQEKMHIWINYFPPAGPFRPTVEDANNPGSFLIDIPIRASYQDINVTMMIGVTSGDGVDIATMILCAGDEALHQLNTKYETLFPIIMSYEWTAKSKDNRYASHILKEYYSGNSQMNTTTVLNFTELLTEGLYGYGVSHAIRAFKGRKYVYLFDYMLDYYTRSSQRCFPKRIAVGHTDDLKLVYSMKEFSNKLKPIDLILGDEIVTRFVNFAHSGDPDKPLPINTSIFGEWEPVRSNRHEYLYLNYNGTMRNEFRRNIYRFWKTLPLNSKFTR